MTHDCHEISRLVKHYPRGEKFLKTVFREFMVRDTIDWFERRSVPLKVEEDGRMFPLSDDSSSIVNVLMDEAQSCGVELKLGVRVRSIEPIDHGFILVLGDGEKVEYDRVIVATGGSPKRTGFQWLEDLGLKIESPVPSLFTFNMPSLTKR